MFDVCQCKLDLSNEVHLNFQFDNFFFFLYAIENKIESIAFVWTCNANQQKTQIFSLSTHNFEWNKSILEVGAAFVHSLLKKRPLTDALLLSAFQHNSFSHSFNIHFFFAKFRDVRICFGLHSKSDEFCCISWKIFVSRQVVLFWSNTISSILQ